MKTRTKFLIAIPAVFLVLIVSGLLYLRSAYFQEWIRTSVISRIQESTGMNCRIARLELDLYSGNFRVNGLELAARNAGSGLASLKVKEIRGTVGLSSIWNFRVHLRELHLVEPQVEFLTGDKTGGGEGWNPDEFLKTLNFSLDLETERLTVEDGLLRINEHTAPFNLSLKDLDCRIGYDGNLHGYRISLAYRQSRLLYEGRDIVHDLKISAVLSIDGIRIETIEFRHGDTQMSGSGSVENWDSPVLSLHMAGIVRSRDMVLADSSLFEGRGGIRAETDIRYDKEGIYLNGSFSLPDGTYRKMTYTDMTGEFEILHDVLYLRNVKGKIAQGNFSLKGEIQLREANNRPNRVTIHSEKVPLVEVGYLLNEPSVNFRNVADAETQLVWGNGQEMTVECSAVLHGMEAVEQEGAVSTPLGGTASFSYGAGGLNLAAANLQSSHTRLSAHGGAEGLFAVALVTGRISEPLDLIAHFSPPVSGLLESYPEVKTMGGEYELRGDVRILSSSDIGYDGNFTVKNGRWRSAGIDFLNTHARLAGSSLSFRDLTVRREKQQVHGILSFDFAGEESLSGFEFQGDFRNIELESLEDWGVSGLGMTGVLDGSGRIRFERDVWAGDGQITIDTGSFKGVPFDRFTARTAFRDGRVHFDNAEVVQGKARMTAAGTIDPDSSALNLTVRLFDLPLEKIPGLGETAQSLRGSANASGTLDGTLDRPALRGTFELSGLGYDAWDLGGGQGDLEYENDNLQGSLTIHSDFGDLAVQAEIGLKDEYPGRLALEFDRLNVGKIVSDKAPSFLDIESTELKGKIEGKGNFRDWTSIKFLGEMDGALFRIHGYELKNIGNIEFSIIRNRMRFNSARIQGTGTDLFLTGELPLDDSSLDLNLNGSLNLTVLSGIVEKLDISGNAVVDIRATGSKQNPVIVGRLSPVKAGLEYEGLPFSASDINGDMLFSANVVRFENITGTVASGPFKLSGSYEHRNGVMQSINLVLSAEEVRLPYPKDFNSLIDANLRLSGDSEFQMLSGEVDILRTEYLRGFSLLERFTESGGGASGLGTTAPFLQNLKLNVEFRSNNGLVIDNELARLRGSLRLTLRGTPAYPSLIGRVEAGDGTIFFHGNRFEISHAYADFVDRNRINPILEIRAEADVKTYRLILDATGALDNLSVNITSDPPMSTVDILSLLTTGRAETGSPTSRRETQMAGMSAASVLSDNLTGVIGKRVERILGLESFRVDPFLAGAENDPTARITISERISPDLVVTFSRNLSTNEEQVVVIEYEIGRGVSVIGTRDEDGDYGIDFRFRKRFR